MNNRNQSVLDDDRIGWLLLKLSLPANPHSLHPPDKGF